MGLKNKLSEMRCLIFIKMIPDMINEYWKFAGETARCNMSKNPDKLLTEILMLTHALEKGLSIKEKKRGFGISKMERLCTYIILYVDKYGYNNQLDVPISVLHVMIDFHESCNVSDKILVTIKSKINELLTKTDKGLKDFCKAGYIEKTSKEMLELKEATFEVLCNQRFSFRHFSDKPVAIDDLLRALDIARKSPSACNRQAYRVHVFEKEKKNRMLLIQGGANSFYQEVDKAILITGNLNRYYTTETHLPYVDASLFGMSLIYALTTNGIASIPLTMGRARSVIKACYKQMEIPKNEVPVLLIAIGYFPQKAQLSMSHRNNINSFTTLH